jgi:hypothetical protein
VLHGYREVRGRALRFVEGGTGCRSRTLEDAYYAERRVAALSIPEREAILRVLEDCPNGLAELRGVLLKEVEWRRREGLA